MRTFVAITLPDDVRTALTDAFVDAPGGLRWARPEQWHLTLAFLGETDRGAEDVAAAVGQPEGPLELALTGPGRFGDRVLWLGIEDRPAGQLHRVARHVRAGLRAAGLPFDDKSFRPHVTVARAARREVTQRDVGWTQARAPAMAWTVDALHVLHSHLGGGPARHEAVATIPFRT
ncbi:MAG: RNA 2',3'-cyclic phosphodiesterase [Nitriliruptorales bacterium]|nr:RNA 2',3'-cyclic phosphodiesterase [Nitriliruptorales bacterium]